jgi:hypothetical protein
MTLGSDGYLVFDTYAPLQPRSAYRTAIVPGKTAQ